LGTLCSHAEPDTKSERMGYLTHQTNPQVEILDNVEGSCFWYKEYDQHINNNFILNKKFLQN
jgi:hypothetical protein